MCSQSSTTNYFLVVVELYEVKPYFLFPVAEKATTFPQNIPILVGSSMHMLMAVHG